jgi:hypothetical protein
MVQRRPDGWTLQGTGIQWFLILIAVICFILYAVDWRRPEVLGVGLAAFAAGHL